MLKTILIISLLLLLFACEQNENITHFKQVNSKVEKPFSKDLSFDSIVVVNEKTSTVGFWKLEGDSLLFFDQKEVSVFIYDVKGNFKTKVLSKGSGPNQLENFQAYLLSNNKRILFSGWEIYVFDLNWEREKVITLDWNETHTVEELEQSPQADYHGVYEINYPEMNPFCTDNGKYVFLPIASSHPLFNPWTSTEYYKKGKIFAKIDLSNGKVVEILGQKSSIYQKYQFVPSFDFNHIFIDNNTVYITFEIDSLIYELDEKMNFKLSFGLAGFNMNSNYKESQTYESGTNLLWQERLSKGFYTDIFKDKDYIFRTYCRGVSQVAPFEQSSSVQVYKNYDLIGDVKVGKKFKILGKIGEFYYADGVVDESADKQILYKFKIQ